MNKFTKSALFSFIFTTTVVAHQESELTLEQLLANVQEDHMICITNETNNEQVCGTDLLAQLFALHIQKNHSGPKLSDLLKKEEQETVVPTVQEITEQKTAELNTTTQA